ncbi:MAG TPA: hypothetical protein VFV35_01585 [Acidimicrobiales bacterium]|nr:hypothetical protein [Acidimicrobiales bacterium]
MRLVRFVLLSGLAGGFVLVGAPAASAQTTTTVPPVRSIPVTGGQAATTTTTAPASSESAGTLAETGMAADVLVPFGFALIGAGAVLQLASRRPREAFGLL